MNAGCPGLVSGRAVRGDRDVRARHGLRRGGDHHPRAARGRRLRRLGREDLHLQRAQRGHDRDRGPHRRFRPPRRHQHPGDRGGDGRASRAGATSRSSARTRRTPPSCSSTRSSCRPRTCSARRARASRYLMRNLAQERLAIAVTAAAGAAGALERTLAYVKERRAFGRPVGHVPELALQARRLPRRDAGHPGAHRRRARRSTSPASCRPRMPRSPSGGPPSPRAGSSTPACSCTAATATCSSTRSRAPTPTRA